MIDRHHPLLLGSSSPRRRSILESLGIPLVVRPVEVDEAPQVTEAAEPYLARVVGAKLGALARLEELPSVGALLVADTAVVCDGAILGKPRDGDEATSMLRMLGGRSHFVMTRFAVSDPVAPGRALVEQTVRTEVWFRRLEQEHIRRYVATGEGRDKAGAYAIQGVAGFAVERIVGSYSNVVGLPACEVVAALEQARLLDGFPLEVAPHPRAER